MSSAVSDDIEAIEQAVYVDTFAAAPPGLLRLSPRVMRDAGAVWGIAAGIEEHGWSRFFNQVLGLGLSVPATQRLIDTTLASYRNAHIPFVVNLSPYAHPVQLSQWLHQHSLVQQHWLAQCYRTLQSPPARVPITPFDIQQIDSANAIQFVHIAAIGLPPALHPWIAALVGRAGWYHYLAYRDGIAVAGAAMFIQDDIGYLTWAGTQLIARNQGAQTALIAHRLQEASERKCQLVVAETFEVRQDQPGVSCRNLLRAGFQIAHYNALYEG